jgi:hypothetical protein
MQANELVQELPEGLANIPSRGQFLPKQKCYKQKLLPISTNLVDIAVLLSGGFIENL